MSQKREIYCVIMAGGVGTRFWPKSRKSMPKQFLDLNGRPIIMHTLQAFLNCAELEQIYMGVHPEWVDYMEATVDKGHALQTIQEYFNIKREETLAFGARAQQELAHRRAHADAHRGHVGFDELHRVVDCHTCGNGSAGRVNVKIDILVGILRFKI